MISRKIYEWLKNELEVWEAKGWLPGDSKSEILNSYDVEKRSSNFLQLFFIVVGALFIGGGVIALVSHNWIYIPRSLRAGGSIFMVVLMQVFTYWVISRDKSKVIKEVAAVGLNFALLGAFAIIGQSYQVSGNINELLLCWLILTIVNTFITKSFVSSIINLIMLQYFIMLNIEGKYYNGEASLWILLLAIRLACWQDITHYFEKGEERYFSRCNFISWGMVYVSVCLFISLFKNLENEKFGLFCAISYPFWILSIALILERVRKINLGVLRVLCIIFCLIILTVFSVTSGLWSGEIGIRNTESGIFIAVFGLTLIAAIWKKSVMASIITAVAMSFVLFGAIKFNSNVIMILYGLVFVSLLIDADKREKLGQFFVVNVLFAIYAVVNFARDDYSLLVKSGVFIVTGILFIIFSMVGII
ncbi:MAG: DUF2157 domain-containing protein, partial [Lentisphaeria bacterium]